MRPGAVDRAVSGTPVDCPTGQRSLQRRAAASRMPLRVGVLDGAEPIRHARCRRRVRHRPRRLCRRGSKRLGRGGEWPDVSGGNGINSRELFDWSAPRGRERAISCRGGTVDHRVVTSLMGLPGSDTVPVTARVSGRSSLLDLARRGGWVAALVAGLAAAVVFVIWPDSSVHVSAALWTMFGT